MRKAIITIVQDDGDSQLFVLIPTGNGATLDRFDAASGNEELGELSDHLYELLLVQQDAEGRR